ncbi:MAG: glycosyltransferase family protein [Magnetococcales bacterium]|nr:glycosyltransferase family protein [Magnetococcales bacterium]
MADSVHSAQQAFMLYAEGHIAEALAVAEHCLAAAPDAALLNLAAICCMQRGEMAQASLYWQRVLSLGPPDPAVLNLAAVCQMELGNLTEARSCWQQAIALQPDQVDAHYNLGHLWQAMQQFDAAEAAFRQALHLRPDHAEAHCHLGTLLYKQKRFVAAEAAYRQALHLQPDHAEAQWRLGVLCLALGRWREGWSWYEARHTSNQEGARPAYIDVPFPRWQGEDLAGKSLLLVAEQGLGDQIQFCRYAATLHARRVERLTLVCAAPLAALFATLAGVDQVLVQNEAGDYPPHDYWILYLSVPFCLGTTEESIPDRIPYLTPPADRLSAWGDRVPATGFRVGLVWQGNLLNRPGRDRSLPSLAVLAPLWSVPGVCFVSLQKGDGEAEAKQPPPDQPLLDWGDSIRDFADTAALVAHLDLVITIDSAVAHLAGALGKPCWVMLPAWGTDWRWLQDRTDSPWYPGILRLFRQTRSGEWSSVVQQVAAELARR